MREDIKVYVDSLENGEPTSREKWISIIEAEHADFEQQDERIERLKDQEVEAILDVLDADGYIKPYEVYTVTKNRDGSVNNEIFEGSFQTADEALKKASKIDGEVRKYANLNDYDII